MPTNREFDVVLWGATGFVGQLTAEYLAEHYRPDELDWAIAGRSRPRLRNLRQSLHQEYGGLGDLDMLVGDAFDRESLDAIAERTDAIASTVGPYAEYGSKLVAACVDRETDYCDLTGEAQWIHDMIERHHETARDRGVRVVHTCGFDSIPSDLGVWMLQQRAMQDHERPCDSIKFSVLGGSGGMSGGTLASMANAFEEASEDPSLRRMLADPYALVPDGNRSGPNGPPQSGVEWDDDLEAWTAPFVMAAVNEKVVHRTNALLENTYGRNFRYRETTSCGTGITGAATAGGLTAGLAAFTGAMAIGPTRNLLRATILPDPGEGPTREAIENGYFDIRLVGTGGEPGETFRLEGRVKADRDPGYGATAEMLGESVVCLANDTVDEGLDGGILTPATAMGTALIERLRDTGMTWSVQEG